MLEVLVFFFHVKNFIINIFFFQVIFTPVPGKKNVVDAVLSFPSSSIGLTKHVSGVPYYHVKFLFIGLGVFCCFCDVCRNAAMGCLS